MKADIRWLDDPEVYQVNRMPAHSDHMYYEREEGDLSQCLDGEWQFFWSPNAAGRPAQFFQMEEECREFGTIQVPGHIELAGFDRIHYINTMYPWEGHQYRRPAFAGPEWGPQPGQFSQADYNPVGSYLKWFDLKPELWDKRVSISFEGAEQALFVWLNGYFVGYSEDSFTPSEFDLTPYVRRKGNKLAVEVHKRSTAAYLEDQDFFRFSGLFRSVRLWGRPGLHLEDLWAKPELEGEEKGRLGLELRLSARRQDPAKERERFRVCYRLMDPAGREVLADEQTVLVQEGTFSLRFSPQGVIRAEAWSSRHPALYRLEVRILDGQGRTAETAVCRIGFRRIEIVDGVMRLNGRRLVIKGVNRHEWSASRGRSITQADMEADMEALQANHINSVRTCHYPDQLPWYSMCDQGGIYVMAEANLESHGSWQKMGKVEPSWNVPGSSPQWKGALLDRIQTNFELLKNHPCVLFWSLGNESYAGDNLRDAQAWLKERDPGRLVHYEGVFHNRAYENVISDVESQMYAPPERVAWYREQHGKKPFLLCEYMHDMGNSLGGLGSYMALLDRYEGFQGGFIWDWIDQALWVKDEVTGRQVLRYGGDFDDRPSDYEFSGNGLLFADRSPKPALQEVSYYYGK